ncbi:hypothetical protein I546_2599 [Mycobacterium kansasii 732]|nr:hypothetical protein I546_2599 [Mycobacterium kansasii 732]
MSIEASSPEVRPVSRRRSEHGVVIGHSYRRVCRFAGG